MSVSGSSRTTPQQHAEYPRVVVGGEHEVGMMKCRVSTIRVRETLGRERRLRWTKYVSVFELASVSAAITS